MDPHQQRDQEGRLDPRGTPLGHSPVGGQTPQQVDGDIQDVGSQPATNRQPQYLGGFTMIPPNQSRRSEMQAVAQKGEQDYQRLKESQRPSAVHLNPERLGGHVTLAEARQKQLTDARSAKLQKKLKKEEAEKKKKQEEEEELQRMKAKQREKAERLEEKKRQDEQRRREQFLEDQTRRTESFLQRFERRAADLPSSAAHTSSKSEDATSEKRGKESKSVRELEQERKRVNMAFLDKLEGQSRRTEKEENIQEAGHSFLEPHNFRQQTTQRGPVTHLTPEEEDSFSGLTSETEPDYDWALMKLMTSFPDCAKCFLEDILTQCDGDYEKAHSLLICTLS